MPRPCRSVEHCYAPRCTGRILPGTMGDRSPLTCPFGEPTYCRPSAECLCQNCGHQSRGRRAKVRAESLALPQKIRLAESGFQNAQLNKTRVDVARLKRGGLIRNWAAERFALAARSIACSYPQ